MHRSQIFLNRNTALASVEFDLLNGDRVLLARVQNELQPRSPRSDGLRARGTVDREAGVAPALLLIGSLQRSSQPPSPAPKIQATLQRQVFLNSAPALNSRLKRSSHLPPLC